jgi:hypothetical protein
LYEGWIDGNAVTLQAIDYKGTSVNREKYSKPADMLRKGFARVGALTASDLPAPMVLNDVEWRFFANDCPNPPEDSENDAHAEIRTRRPKDGAEPKARWPGSEDARNKLRAALADKIQLL